MALFNVLFDIAARTAKFEEGITRVERRLDKMSKFAKSASSTVAGAFVTGALAQFAREAIDTADNMKTLSDRMGVSVESLSRLQYVAEQSNSSLETLKSGLDKLQKGLSQAEDGGGRATKALGLLGIEASFLTRLPVDEQLNVLADAFKRIETPADQTRIAVELFGDAGTELVPVLRQGSNGIRAMGDEAQRLGAVMSTGLVDKLSGVDEETKKLVASTRTLRAELTGLVATPLSTFLTGWTEILTLARKPFESGGGPVEELQRDLAKINKMIDQAGPFEDTSRLEAARKEIKGLIYQYEQAAQSQSRLLQQFAQLEGKTAKSLGEKLLAEAQEREKKVTTIRERGLADRLEVTVSAQRIELSAMQKFYAELDESTRTSTERMVADFYEAKSKLDLLFRNGLIDPAKYSARASELVDEVLQPIEVSSRRMVVEVQKNSTQMSVFAEQAARNIQDAFADFLFDPFSSGLKGMLRGFIDVVRRMVAEAAAAKIFDALKGSGGGGGIGGFLGGLLGGLFKAEGGPVSGGRPYIVGERGPELFIPGMSGGIVPNESLAAAGSAAPITINNYVDARGSSISRAELNAALNQSSEVTVAKVRDLVSRGRL